MGPEMLRRGQTENGDPQKSVRYHARATRVTGRGAQLNGEEPPRPLPEARQAEDPELTASVDSSVGGPRTAL